MGWLLGLGSCRERGLHADRHRKRISPLGDDSGKAGSTQSLERVSDLFDLLPDDLWNVLDPIWNDQERSRLRTVIHRYLLRCLFDAPRRIRDHASALAVARAA